jgi:hypothetical protein
MDDRIQKTLKSLEARGMKAWFAKDIREARHRMLNIISKDATVGVGDSSTVRQIGIIKSLKKRGTKVINPFDLKKTVKDDRTHLEFLFRPTLEATVCDVFLTGTNAVTQDGRLLNIDGVGNRVAGMVWGHPQVVLAVGKNKIVRNLDDAFDRVKNVIAPEHLRRRGAPSPCTVTRKCLDCIGRHRVCAITTIIENRPMFTEINVMIVDEDLGLGWDKSWPKERINQIAEKHQKFMWTIPNEVIQSLDMKGLWDKRKIGNLSVSMMRKRRKM